MGERRGEKRRREGEERGRVGVFVLQMQRLTKKSEMIATNTLPTWLPIKIYVGHVRNPFTA